MTCSSLASHFHSETEPQWRGCSEIGGSVGATCILLAKPHEVDIPVSKELQENQPSRDTAGELPSQGVTFLRHHSSCNHFGSCNDFAVEEIVWALTLFSMYVLSWTCWGVNLTKMNVFQLWACYDTLSCQWYQLNSPTLPLTKTATYMVS